MESSSGQYLINSEHAYAYSIEYGKVPIKIEELNEFPDIKLEETQDLFKIEEPDNFLNTSEIMIKTEPTDIENMESMLCDEDSSYIIETQSVESESRINPVQLEVAVVPENLVDTVDSTKFMLIEKVALEHIQDELMNKNNVINNLVQTNKDYCDEIKKLKKCKAENQCLKKQLLEIKKGEQSSTRALLIANKSLQKDLKNYEIMKKRYCILEKQINELMSKMGQSLVKLPESLAIIRLKSQMDLKDKLYRMATQKISSLAVSVSELKQQISTVVDTHKVNVLQANERAEAAEYSNKSLLNSAREKEQKLKKLKAAMDNLNSRRERELQTKIREHEEIRGKYRSCVFQREAHLKTIDKLKRKLLPVEEELEKVAKEKETRDVYIKYLEQEIKDLNNKGCEYCGG